MSYLVYGISNGRRQSKGETDTVVANVNTLNVIKYNARSNKEPQGYR